MKILQLGDRVRIRTRPWPLSDNWCEGWVYIASTNGKSVAVAFDEDHCLPTEQGVYFKSVPLLIDYENKTVEDLMGNHFELEYMGLT